MKNITLLMFVLMGSFSISLAQTNCLDINEYVSGYKNVGGTGYYTLTGGDIEMASQTYEYSGPGNIIGIRVHGAIPLGLGWWYNAQLKISIYEVDANNRPTTEIAHQNIYWNYWETERNVYFGDGGIPLDNDFAVSVELMPYFSGQEFQIEYTGAGEGLGEDLPSSAGTSTGGNWVSLLPTNDGDLNIQPSMNHYIEADYVVNKTCNVAVGEMINFTDISHMTEDPMFNTINLSGYTGSQVISSWDFGDATNSTLTNPSHSYSSPGVYTVTLTKTIDAWPMGGSTFCSDSYSQQISVGLEVNGSPTYLSCYKDNSGSITMAASGGDNSDYQYSIDGIIWQSSPIFNGLDAGTYSIYVKDGLGCVESGSSVTLLQPLEIVIDIQGITLATCGNSDGSLLINASGGTGSLEYSLDDITYQSTGDFSNLSAGSYTVYVRDDNSCIETTNVAVNSTNSPDLILQSYTNVSCKGGNDGSVVLIGSGGTGALQYSIDGVTFQSSGSFPNVSAGYYTPIVMDAAGCIGSFTCLSVCGIDITEPTNITFGLTHTPVSCNGGNDGQIDVVGTIGGTGTKTYSIDGVNYQSGSHFVGLSAGFYTVIVKDAADCMASSPIVVTEPNPIVATVDASTDLSCNESSDGSISVFAVGGVGKFTYSLDGINFYPSGEFQNLEAGTYVIIVEDENGCLSSTSTILTEPSEITATITTGNSTCGNANGTILIAASGGSGSGYSYSNDGGITNNGTGAFSALASGTHLILATDGVGCEEVFHAFISDSDGPTILGSTSTDVTCNGGHDGTITITSVTGGTGTIMYSVDGGQFQTSNMLGGLEAGEHTVLIMDSNGCTGEIVVNLNEPAAISMSLTISDVTCYDGEDGSIIVSAGGGAGTLAYNINGGAYVSTSMFTGLSSGTYIVGIKDAGQCEVYTATTINQPPKIIVNSGILEVACHNGGNGAINSSAIGGTGTLSYYLGSTGPQFNGNFSSLNAGEYILMVEDAAGCQVFDTLSVHEPDVIEIGSTVIDVTCSGGDNGVIDLSVLGGVPPYSYAWSNLKITEDIFNLSAGTYTVSVTDANGCGLADAFTVSEPSNPIIVNGVVTNASSATAANGTIDITVTGGSAPYTYDWSNGSSNEDLNSLLPGVYVIIITDANECTFTTSFVVSFALEIEDVSGTTLSIYPNPAMDVINLELGDEQIIEKVELVNLAGQVVYQNNPASNKVIIDVHEFAEGAYFINILVGQETITKKVIINR